MKKKKVVLVEFEESDAIYVDGKLVSVMRRSPRQRCWERLVSTSTRFQERPTTREKSPRT